MKKDILLIAHFCSDFDSEQNNRFNYIANLLVNENNNVELVTSDFSHVKKQKRNKTLSAYASYKVTYIDEPEYQKNVSIKRIFSHRKMAKNLKKYLASRKLPDVIYCAVPSLDVAKVAADYSRKNKIRFIIDIQDLWPEAFQMVFNPPIVGNILYYPMKKKADYVYKTADDIIAVSKTYLQRGLLNNRNVKNSHVVFLGTDLERFDFFAKKNDSSRKKNEELIIGYSGTLGHSYDITIVIEALEIVQRLKPELKLKFLVMGDGPLFNIFRNRAEKSGVEIIFTGRLPYDEMVGLLISCDIAVNPIMKHAAQSIINKHADYAAAGLPVINTQESNEYRFLIDNYEAGFNCKNNNAEDIAEKMIEISQDVELRMKMGRNSRRMAEELFDRKFTYQEIVHLISGM